MKKHSLSCLACLALVLEAPRALAQSPRIPYTGRLELSGQAASGVHDFRFGLFAAADGDAGCLVTATQPTDSCGLWWTQLDDVLVRDGTFGVLLGQASHPLSNAVLAQPEVYLAIAVKQDVASAYTLLAGKQRIAEVPRAAAARDFTVGGDLTVGGSIAATGNISSQGEISGFGVVPVGSIIPWYKHMGGTAGTLPGNWVECNGQSISVPNSPFTGLDAPDLNNSRKFLRGAQSTDTTGITDVSGIGAHQHMVAKATGGVSGSFYAWTRKVNYADTPAVMTLVNNSVWGGGGGTGDDDTVYFPAATGYSEYSVYRAVDDPNEAVWPTYFTVTWIMRVK
ncbi:MAG: hypothetical protein ABIJ09_24505 [Pseudomonadota bacterium]